MPIYMQSEERSPSGPDGEGWNRFAISTLCVDECALKPLRLTAFFEAMNTQHSKYGMYGPCANKGECGDCHVYSREIEHKFMDECMYIRISNDVPWIMNRLNNGWEEYGKRTSFEYLLSLQDVDFSIAEDKHGKYIIAMKMKNNCTPDAKKPDHHLK